jgi:hypothetical protein
MTPEIEERNLTKELEFKLSSADFERIGREAAQIQHELTAHRIEEKKIKTELKDKRVGLENGLARVLKVIEQGTEVRQVDCIERKNFSENKVEYVFNGEVIESRPMEGHERQMELDPADKTIVRRKRDGRALAAGPDENDCVCTTFELKKLTNADGPDEHVSVCVDCGAERVDDDAPANLPEAVECAKEDRLTDEAH